MHVTEVTADSPLLATLEYGEPLGRELAALAGESSVRSAWFFGTGAVQDAELGYYDQETFETETVTVSEPLGMPMLTGTITDGDGEPEISAYAVLARPSGQPLAGSLEAATVYGAEVYVQPFDVSLDRNPSDATGMDRLAL